VDRSGDTGGTAVALGPCRPLLPLVAVMAWVDGMEGSRMERPTLGAPEAKPMCWRELLLFKRADEGFPVKLARRALSSMP